MTIEFPPNSLRQYALIADGERGAMVGPHGDLTFLCAPRWHDPAVFSELVGGPGVFAVTPVGRYVWGGEYSPGSLIWRHEWATAGGSIIECRDALARPADPRQVTVLRRIRSVKGAAGLTAILDVRAGFGAHRMTELRRDQEGDWTGRSGELRFRVQGMATAVVDDQGRLRQDIRLTAGEHHDLALLISTGRPDRLPIERAWRDTVQAWSQTPALDDSAAPRDARHAVAVLTGLTSADGGTVAAATMALPERAGDGTNYDYRYSWIRDQAHVGIAAASLGAHPLVRASADFVAARLADDGPNLKPAYRVDGQAVPGESRLNRSGYPGAADVVGNHAASQFQLDAFGEALQLFAAADRVGVATAEHREAAALAGRAIALRWSEADCGVWELDRRHWSESRLSCVAGLRQIAMTIGGPDRDWIERLADRILRATVDSCRDPRGFLRRSPRDDRVDAAILLPIARGALPPDDPLVRGTLAAIRRRLIEDWYVYRYVDDEGLVGRTEGAFLLCGFMYAMTELAVGNLVAAFRAFERNRASCGPPGLLSEEFDVRQRQLRGNLPQAFVHAALLDTSMRLGGTAGHGCR